MYLGSIAVVMSRMHVHMCACVHARLDMHMGAGAGAGAGAGWACVGSCSRARVRACTCAFIRVYVHACAHRAIPIAASCVSLKVEPVDRRGRGVEDGRPSVERADGAGYGQSGESTSRNPARRARERRDEREHGGDSGRAATGDEEQAQPGAAPRSWALCSVRDADGALHHQLHGEHELHRLVEKRRNEDGLVSRLFD